MATTSGLIASGVEFALALALSATGTATAQVRVEAPGVVPYTHGQVALDGSPLSPASGYAQLATGQVLTTTSGSADLVLGRGATMRLGSDSSVRMVAQDAGRTEVRLEMGRADVTVNLVPKGRLLLVDMPGGQVQMVANGLYSFLQLDGKVRVFNGEALAFPGAATDASTRPVKIKQEHELLLSEDHPHAERFDRELAESDLLPWGPHEAETTQTYASTGSAGYGYGYGGYGSAFDGTGLYDGGYPYGGFGLGYGGFGSPFAYSGFGLGLGFGYGGLGWGGPFGFGGYGFGGYPFFGAGFYGGLPFYGGYGYGGTIIERRPLGRPGQNPGPGGYPIPRPGGQSYGGLRGSSMGRSFQGGGPSVSSHPGGFHGGSFGGGGHRYLPSRLKPPVGFAKAGLQNAGVAIQTVVTTKADTATPNEAQRKDAAYARLAEEFQADLDVPQDVRTLARDKRVAVRRAGKPDPKGRCVAYWMQRAERGLDNHALDKAVELGNALGLPVVVYFAGISDFPHANLRHYAFLNEGLVDVAEDCAERGVGFVLRNAPYADRLQFMQDVHPAIVVGDENPMRVPESWRVEMAEQLTVPFWTVDADVIVPSRLLEKAQYSGAIARPRIRKLMPEFVKPFTNPKADTSWHTPKGLYADDPRKDMTAGWKDLDRSVGPVAYWQGGRKEAGRRLQQFTSQKLKKYADDRKHPERDATSRLSPYLHYGHIGPVTIANAINAAVEKDPGLAEARDSYFNEVITWRELSVNFCRYQPDYDNTGCVDHWAEVTIEKHDKDKRPVLYTRDQLEQAQTYDDLWNAAQVQMVRHGWMPNYLRMYWGKKIVEWTPDAAAAMEWMIYLNDKYFLDGRDPNGYASIAWAVLGKFDRPWQERPIFGKRRYMSGESAARKFDAKSYIRDANDLPK